MDHASPHAGVIVPMVTPFTNNGRVDPAAVTRILHHMTSAGIRGIFLLGTTGEGVSIPLEQRLFLVQITARALASIPDASFYINISATCLEDSQEAAQRYFEIAQDSGAPITAFVAHVPFYFPLSARAIEHYFRQLADSLPAPLMVYNIPQTTHISLAVETVEALMTHPRIVGLKDSDGDAPRLTAQLHRTGQFPVLIGTSRLATLGMKAGASGVVVSGGNLDPDIWMQWWHAVQSARASGNWSPVDALQSQLDKLTLQYTENRSLADSIATLKRLMYRRGLCNATVLPPLMEEAPDAPLEDRSMKHRNFKPRITRAILSIICIASPIFAADLQPIVNVATEQKLLIPKTPDGGLPPLVGVQNIQVFRASKGVPELAGWTYNHHMDLAQWHGRLYLAWTNGEKDEDVWPAHEMFTSSEDGFHWSAPAELFPQGMSTSLRTYFYHAKNGRMLAIAGLRMNTDKLAEANKGGIIVREIRADHTLAAPYILQDGPSQPKMAAPKFDTAADPAFVEACHLLLADHTFLEQQDFGSLLGKNRMAVYTGADKDFGRAMCFFSHCPDGTLVGIGKKAWEILSTDEGKTWSTPQTVKSLITGNAKVWVQRTSDGQFAMIYNPTASDRFPLVAMTSADGITFNNMRLIHGDVAPQRYEGANRSVGPQYTRGISEWASDGSTLQGPAAGDMWIVYSSSKEDIWVSHIPVPFKLDQSTPVKDDLSATPLGGLVPGWNTYGPKWGGVSIAEAPDKSHAIKLEDRDPYDYAKAERVFSESANPAIHFQVLSTGVGSLEIELHTAFGEARPVRLILADGKLSSGATQLATIPPNQWLDLSLAISPGLCAIAIPGQSAAILPFAEPAQKVARLTFRTGPYRPVAESKFIDPATDKPTPPAIFFVKDVTISG